MYSSILFYVMAATCLISWSATTIKTTTVAFSPSIVSRSSTFHYSHELPISRSIYKRKRQRGYLFSCLKQTNDETDTTAVAMQVNSVRQVNRLLQANDTSPILVNGVVTAKRSFGPSFGFVDICTTSENQEDDDDDGIVQLMVKRQDYRDGELGGMLRAINQGMHIRVRGVACETRNPGESVVLVHACAIEKLPPNPQHVRSLLRLVVQNKLSASQIAHAANMTSDTLQARIREASNESDDYNALAKELLSWSPNKKQKKLKEKTETPSDGANKRLFPVVPLNLCRPPLSIYDINSKPTTTIPLVIIESVADLNRRLDEVPNKSSATTLVTLEASVQNRRRFRDSTTVVKVSDSFVAVAGSESDNDTSSRLQCVLHPDLMGKQAASVYGALLCAGARVLLEGHVSRASETTTSSSRPTLWVTSVQLLRCSWRPMVVRHLMELLVRNEFNVDEAATALDIDSVQAAQLSQLDLTERQWKAMELSQTLQDSKTRTARVSPEMMKALPSFEQLRSDYPIHQVNDTTASSFCRDGDQPKTDLLATNDAGTWWQRKKRPQLEFMGQQIQDVVRSHPDYNTRRLRILDVGGGKGVLASYLAQLLGDSVEIQVIDIAGGAIKNGMMRSKRLQLASPVVYVMGDAAQHEYEADIVVALHACGALSDVALGHAVNHGAGFVICPCCFRSNPHLRVPMQRNGGARQFQTPREWLGVDADEFDSIKRIAEVQGDRDIASQAMHTICAMRANAVRRHSAEQTERKQEATIKTFPVSFSTRNFCLVGKVERSS